LDLNFVASVADELDCAWDALPGLFNCIEVQGTSRLLNEDEFAGIAREEIGAGWTNHMSPHRHAAYRISKHLASDSQAAYFSCWLALLTPSLKTLEAVFCGL